MPWPRDASKQEQYKAEYVAWWGRKTGTTKNRREQIRKWRLKGGRKARANMVKRHNGASPALMVADQQKMMRERFGQADEMALEELPGWETFKPRHKRWLSVLPYFNNRIAAAEYALQLNHQQAENWVTNSCAKYPVLRKAAQQRSPRYKDHMNLLMRNYMSDLAGKSFVKLDAMVDNDKDPKLQLDAIKHIHRMVGITEPEGQTPVTAKVNLQNIVMFAPKPDEPVSIETTAEVINDD